MKPKIIVVANDVHFGLAYQRLHASLSQLKDHYYFEIMSFDEIGKAHPHYYDAIIISHPYTKANADFIARVQQQYQIPVIVDIDDLLDNLPVDHPGYQYFIDAKIAQCLMFASHVTVSTDYLKLTYGHLNKNITLIENTVDMKRYAHLQNVPKPHKVGFTVGWTGSQSHRPDLYNTEFIEGLQMAMLEDEEIRAYFHVLCPQTLIDRFGVRITFNPKPVDYLDWPTMCATLPFDICAVPLYDHPFNEAKSDLRLLDMGAVKIPVLASPRGQFDRHKERGLCLTVKADRAADWCEGILQAKAQWNELPSLGERINQYLKSEREVSSSAKIWHQLLQTLLEKKPA